MTKTTWSNQRAKIIIIELGYIVSDCNPFREIIEVYLRFIGSFRCIEVCSHNTCSTLTLTRGS